MCYITFASDFGRRRIQVGMSELVDEADSKSAAGDCVWVRVPLPALKRSLLASFFVPTGSRQFI